MRALVGASSPPASNASSPPLATVDSAGSRWERSMRPGSGSGRALLRRRATVSMGDGRWAIRGGAGGGRCGRGATRATLPLKDRGAAPARSWGRGRERECQLDASTSLPRHAPVARAGGAFSPDGDEDGDADVDEATGGDGSTSKLVVACAGEHGSGVRIQLRG